METEVPPPPCPAIFFERSVEQGDDNAPGRLQCSKLKVNIECYVSTAIVEMTGTWKNHTSDILSCWFALPTKGLITDANVRLGNGRVITTAIISHEEAQELIAEQEAMELDEEKKSGSRKRKPRDIMPTKVPTEETYYPDLFRLHFDNVQPGESVEITCQYLNPLPYYKKGYHVFFPLYFPQGFIQEDLAWREVVKVKLRINTLSEQTAFTCPTHELEFNDERKADGNFLLNLGAPKPLPEQVEYMEDLTKTGRDLDLFFEIRSDGSNVHAIRKVDDYDDDDEEEKTETMCIFVTGPKKILSTFGRAFVFLLDRSGSMEDEPFAEATNALYAAMDRLRPKADTFTICAYDHTTSFFRDALVKATRENVAEAKAWIQDQTPQGGGTVLDKPIEKAVDILEGTPQLPFLFLITDGAVQNERMICKKLQKKTSDVVLRTRLMTMGIGPYCNWFFLKLLAQIGRGFSDVVLFREEIRPKVDLMMKWASSPVFTELEVGFRGSDIDMYPLPVPDLFVHCPLVLSASYKVNEKPPQTLIVRGVDSKGERHEIVGRIEERSDLPVEKIFIKQKIDLLTAQAWYEETDKLKKDVIHVSCESNVPSMYTSLIAFELDAQAAESLGKDDDEKGDKAFKKAKESNSPE